MASFHRLATLCTSSLLVGAFFSKPLSTVGVITGNVITKIYPVHPPSHVVKRAALAELGGQLDQWYAGLPDYLAFDPAGSRSIPLPNVLMMHATYWNTVLLLHRCL
jgi:hypothetical protein